MRFEELPRREVIALLGGTAVAALLPARVNAVQRVYRIGYLGLGSLTTEAARYNAFRLGLAALGYHEGGNFVMEARWLDGNDYVILDALVAQLVRLNVDVIVTYAAPGVLAAKRAAPSTPIVFASAGDAVGSGLVANLAHPGGEATGNTYFPSELAAQRLKLLDEAYPGLSQAGVVFNPTNSSNEPLLSAMKDAARSRNVELAEFPVRAASDLEDAFSAMSSRQVRAFVMTDDPMLVRNSKACAKLAIEHRLAACGFPEFAATGGFAGFGIDFLEMWGHAASFVDKILKGARPADLPVEPATRFVTVINRKTAAAIGVSVPAALLSRADRVID